MGASDAAPLPPNLSVWTLELQSRTADLEQGMFVASCRPSLPQPEELASRGGRAAGRCTVVEPRITATKRPVQSCPPPACTGAAPGYPRIDLCELRHTDATPLDAASVIQVACIRMGIRLSDPSSDSSGDSCASDVSLRSMPQPSRRTSHTRSLVPTNIRSQSDVQNTDRCTGRVAASIRRARRAR